MNKVRSYQKFTGSDNDEVEGEKNKAQTNPKHFLKRESHSLYCLCAILFLWMVFICEEFRKGSAESWSWGGKTQAPVQAGTTKAAWQKRSWGGLGSGPTWMWATNLCSWQRQPTASWAAWGKVSAAGWGRWSCLSAQPWWGHTQQKCQALLCWDGLEGASCPHKRLCTQGTWVCSMGLQKTQTDTKGATSRKWEMTKPS